MRFNIVHDNGSLIHVPKWLIAFGALELATMLIILYFNYVSPSVYAAGYEARIVVAISFAMFLHASATLAAASIHSVALWPATYVK